MGHHQHQHQQQIPPPGNPEVLSRSRADVDLLSVLGLQKGVSTDQAGATYGTGTGGSGMHGGGGGGGQQFAFHEPQPGARRTRTTNGGGGGMALDPRSRVPVGRAGVRAGVRAGSGVSSHGPMMTAEEMERIIGGK